MAEYRLYRTNESGNAYKATLMPNLCGPDWGPVFIEFFLGDKRTERYLFEINELGEIPGLEHDGRRLTQCGVILRYLTGIDRTGFPNIKAWAARIAAPPGWAHPYYLMKRGFPRGSRIEIIAAA